MIKLNVFFQLLFTDLFQNDLTGLVCTNVSPSSPRGASTLQDLVTNNLLKAADESLNGGPTNEDANEVCTINIVLILYY
jgi:hypothetical protein